MRHKTQDVAGMLVFLALCAIVAAGVFVLSADNCSSRGHAVGRVAEWGPFEGCTLTTITGEKVPLENYGVID